MKLSFYEVSIPLVFVETTILVHTLTTKYWLKKDNSCLKQIVPKLTKWIIFKHIAIVNVSLKMISNYKYFIGDLKINDANDDLKITKQKVNMQIFKYSFNYFKKHYLKVTLKSRSQGTWCKLPIKPFFTNLKKYT